MFVRLYTQINRPNLSSASFPGSWLPALWRGKKRDSGNKFGSSQKYYLSLAAVSCLPKVYTLVSSFRSSFDSGRGRLFYGGRCDARKPVLNTAGKPSLMFQESITRMGCWNAGSEKRKQGRTRRPWNGTSVEELASVEL